MKLKNVFIITGIFVAISLSAQERTYPETPRMTPAMTEWWTPQPAIVTPGKAPEAVVPAPSDAIVLFDGTDLSKWRSTRRDGGEAPWTVTGNYFTIVRGSGGIRTIQEFTDFQLHIEWRVPVGVEGTNQSRGNSGVFLQGIYEIQVLDNYENETYVNGQAGSVYKQTAPLVNAMRPPGEWNVYQIIYKAPTFTKDGKYRTHPTVTVIHNGVLIQNNTIIQGTTEYIGFPQVRVHGAGPIMLQDHNDPGPQISFRNIWIREL